MQELANRTVQQLLEITHRCMEAYLKDGEGARVSLDVRDTMECVHMARQLLEDFVMVNRGGGR